MEAVGQLLVPGLEWVPTSTSARGRLAVAALGLLGTRAYESVSVGELAAAAKVTTGVLYHHFGSTLGLYDFVREDVEQRVLDRIGAAVAAGSAVTPRLWVGADREL